LSRHASSFHRIPGKSLAKMTNKGWPSACRTQMIYRKPQWTQMEAEAQALLDEYVQSHDDGCVSF
jgi:hypothetical protein